MPQDTDIDRTKVKDAAGDATDGMGAADGTETPMSDEEAAREYEEAVREFVANRDRLMEEVADLRQQADEMLEGEGPNDSGHIADVISEDGDAVSGAIVWSASGRKFVVTSADGEPVSDLEAEQAMELVESRRIAFDNAAEHERFVARMSSMGVDVDSDRVAVSPDGSTGELLVTPDDLMGNERHHMTGEHAGGNVEWEDEVDLSDPKSTGPQRIEEIRERQIRDAAAAPAPASKKVSGRAMYRTDMVMTVAAVLSVVVFYLLTLILQRPTPLMTGVWSLMCTFAAAGVLAPLTTSMETRERTIGTKMMLTGSVAVMFAIMSVLTTCDAISRGIIFPDSPTEAAEDAGDGDGGNVMLDFEPTGDVVSLNVTGSTKAYPSIAVGDVLVTTGEAGQAASLTASIADKSYVAQEVATVDGLGISAFAVESAGSPKPIGITTSVSIGQGVLVYAIGDNGGAVIEGAVIKSTTFPAGVRGMPESSEIDRVILDRNLTAGTLVMDTGGNLIGIAPENGNSVVTGTSISKAVNVLTSSDGEIYVGVVCRQASSSESEHGGAYVENVLTGSPAANAGVMTGDVIVAVDGQTVDGTDDLDQEIGRHDAGEQVSLGILRDGREISIGITLGRSGKAATKGDGSAKSGSGKADEKAAKGGTAKAADSKADGKAGEKLGEGGREV